MRIVYWLFFVSVALFISGIGFVIAAARPGTAVEAAAAPAPTAPIASVQQIMVGITQPNVRVVYDAVGTIINADGITEIEPKTDEEWANVANAAVAVIESGNLLLIDGRRLDEGDWVTMTKDMMEKGQAALEAAQAKDKNGILEVGGPLNDTCDTCHAKYFRQ
jgi:hypothetical protein